MRSRPSARGYEFRETVKGWLRDNRELLVLSRINRGGGRKEWYLIRTLADLDFIIETSRPSDCLTVFSEPQLPFRGRGADRSTWEAALEIVGRSEESVFGEIVDSDPWLRDSFAATPGDEEWVEGWLTDRPNGMVAFGPYPPYLDPDPAVAADGIVPNPDGSVTPGVY